MATNYYRMKNIRYIVLTILLTFSIFSCVTLNKGKKNFKENNDMSTINYVPNEETAIKIAEAIWLPIYGEKIYQQKPYIVTLVNGNVWIIKGSLSENKRGGVAYIEIQKKDCKILNVIHGK
ncbi:YbbC/YhhH family protein [Flavobacterium psychrophilum]|nr:YbbC/YhhH family protein [Flavobacterium psychrophilum]